MNTELTVYREIRASFAAFSAEEAEAAVLLLKARAETLNMTLDKYIARFHPEGLAQKDDALPDRYRGYTQFLGNDVRAIINAGKSADFSTFVHESAHVFRRQLTGKLKVRAERAFAVENSAWTVEQEERFAKGLEEYIRTREAADDDRKHVFEKGAKFVRKVYNGLGRIVDLTPEMKAVYEELFQANKIESNGKTLEFNQQRYEEHLRNIANGDKKGTLVLLGATPPIYEELGFRHLPLMTTRQHLEDIMRPKDAASQEHLHGLDVDILKQIPEQLKNPLIILQSKTKPESIVSILELKDKDNLPIIVPIVQNRQGKFERVEININQATSIYGKEGFEYFLTEAIKENRLLYASKEKSRTLLHSDPHVRRLVASVLRTETYIPSNKDVSGFFIENITKYQETVNELNAENPQILFQTNVQQLMFDFGEPEQRGRKDAAEAGPEQAAEPEAAAKEPPPAQPAEPEQGGGEEEPPLPPDAADARFEPQQAAGVYDYTACPPNRALLASAKDILTKERPSYIPEMDEDRMRSCRYYPVFEKQPDGNFLIRKECDANTKVRYLVTPEIFAATIDYYVKRQKARNQLAAQTKRENLRAKAREFLANPPDGTIETRAGIFYKEVLEGKHLEAMKADPVRVMPSNRAAREQFRRYQGTRREQWEQYRKERGEIDQKLADMQSQIADLQSAYTKGTETSYGDGGTSGTLFEQYGVLVKRQNGSAITPAEIGEVKAALEGVAAVYGSLKAVSGAYGLKISHAGALNMHARRASGLFHDYYHAIGVSFGAKEDAPFILAHETAHFLDALAGKESSHFFASDNYNTAEADIARSFRGVMNKDSRIIRSDYYNRTCECFARALEQYAAMQLSPERYAGYCGRKAYCADENFTRIIAPKIERLIAERGALWHPETAERELSETVGGTEAAAMEAYARKQLSREKFVKGFESDLKKLDNAMVLSALKTVDKQANKERADKALEKYRAVGKRLDEPFTNKTPEAVVERNRLRRAKKNYLAEYVAERQAYEYSDECLALLQKEAERRGLSASEAIHESGETESAAEAEVRKQPAFAAGALRLIKENTAEHYFENACYIAASSADYADNPIEAAREIIRSSPQETRAAILAYLKQEGCITPETTWARINQEYAASEHRLHETEAAKPAEQSAREDGHGRTVANIELDGKPAPPGFRPYGAWTDFGKRLSLAEREKLNSAAAAIIAKEPPAITEEERAALRRYSGFGGISSGAADNERGVLYDYYTSPPIADMVWKLLEKIEPVKEGERVLEPSCGTGVFFETAPQGAALTGVELDGRTAAVAGLLHPHAAIANQSFEQFNLSDKRGGFDRVIGNAPFGERSVETAFMDKPAEKSLDRYFVSRAIDNLKDGGTMALIAASGIIENSTDAGWRLEMTRKARFLGAVKLSDESFRHTHTAVQPSILFFRKYPKDITERLAHLSGGGYLDTGLSERTFVEGDYFKAYPKHIMGEASEGSGQWGRDEVKGAVTPETIAQMLDAFTPMFEGQDQALFEEARRGYEAPESAETRALLPLTAEEQARAAGKTLREGNLKVHGQAVYALNDERQWERLSAGAELAGKAADILALSDSIDEIRARMRENAEYDYTKALQGFAAVKLGSYKDKYGAYPGEDADIQRFVGQYPAVKGIYDAFITPEVVCAPQEHGRCSCRAKPMLLRSNGDALVERQRCSHGAKAMLSWSNGDALAERSRCSRGATAMLLRSEADAL